MRKLITLFPVLLLMTSCRQFDTRLKIVNNSLENLNVDWGIDTIPTYPSINNTEFYLSNPILPYDTLRAVEDAQDGWERYLKNSKSGKLNLFIYRTDTIKKYGINRVLTNKMYKRIILSKDKLEKLGWVVIIYDDYYARCNLTADPYKGVLKR